MVRVSVSGGVEWGREWVEEREEEEEEAIFQTVPRFTDLAV